MGTQIKNLTKFQMTNLFGINVIRHTSDKKAKNKAIALGIVWLFVIAVLFLYVGGFVYGFIQLGLEDTLPMYLIAVASLVIFFFSMFMTGSVIFQKNGYDIISSLPLSQTAIVISRFLRMYVENLLFVFAILIPGIGVYAFLLHPPVSFYLIALLEAFFLPMVPLTFATLLGALVTAITSRMRYKSLIGAGLSIVLVVIILIGSSSLGGYDENALKDMILSMSDMLTKGIAGIYPPAVWLGNAMLQGDFLLCILCIAGFLVIFTGMVALVSVKFHSICRGLFSTYSKNNYKMGTLKQEGVLFSMCKREMKRYFASSVYVTNTIIGPIMGVLLAIGVLVSGVEKLKEYIPLQTDLAGLLPFVLSCVLCMMPTTCSSVSLEGKQWWIVKSLPVSTQMIFDSKVLMNLILIAPFYLVSEVLLVIALKPVFLDTIWLVVIPAIFCVFACEFGITINLKFPVFNWENEVTVVKQSASALIGGLGGPVIIILCAVPVVMFPQVSADFTKLVICIMAAGLTIFLRSANARTNLLEL